jgi:uncharacterized protein YidB (DUF937 family)
VDIADVIRRVINSEDGNHTAHHTTLGTSIADALADAGLAQLGDDQVADYIRDLGDRTGLTTGDIVDRLAEAIEQDFDEDDA